MIALTGPTISRLRSTPPRFVATHAAVACDDAMTWDGWVIIGSHDSADGAGCLRIAGPGRDFFVCHRLPFRDLPHDVANFVGEAFHIPSVALCSISSRVFSLSPAILCPRLLDTCSIHKS